AERDLVRVAGAVMREGKLRAVVEAQRTDERTGAHEVRLQPALADAHTIDIAVAEHLHVDLARIGARDELHSLPRTDSSRATSRQREGPSSGNFTFCDSS